MRSCLFLASADINRHSIITGSLPLHYSYLSAMPINNVIDSNLPYENRPELFVIVFDSQANSH